jgi:hypothetical protein
MIDPPVLQGFHPIHTSMEEQPPCQRAIACRFSYLAIQHPRRRWLATGEGGNPPLAKTSRLGPARRPGASQGTEVYRPASASRQIGAADRGATLAWAAGSKAQSSGSRIGVGPAWCQAQRSPNSWRVTFAPASSRASRPATGLVAERDWQLESGDHLSSMATAFDHPRGQGQVPPVFLHIVALVGETEHLSQAHQHDVHRAGEIFSPRSIALNSSNDAGVNLSSRRAPRYGSTRPFTVSLYHLRVRHETSFIFFRRHSYRKRDQIISSAMHHGLATIFGFPPAAREGALIAYGPD